MHTHTHTHMHMHVHIRIQMHMHMHTHAHMHVRIHMRMYFNITRLFMTDIDTCTHAHISTNSQKSDTTMHSIAKKLK